MKNLFFILFAILLVGCHPHAGYYPTTYNHSYPYYNNQPYYGTRTYQRPHIVHVYHHYLGNTRVIHVYHRSR